ncbi:hypothetical protein NPIL_83231 [Nephila pilipes]|uniref:Uncharacterized protein n=1 Tax=Nephila pilipes TaxID=299642 RepID=A0A8X6N580_NEPPI|nr:hypothetical protein NPIL_83231 [Nephila pilipes]
MTSLYRSQLSGTQQYDTVLPRMPTLRRQPYTAVVVTQQFPFNSKYQQLRSCSAYAERCSTGNYSSGEHAGLFNAGNSRNAAFHAAVARAVAAATTAAG